MSNPLHLLENEIDHILDNEVIRVQMFSGHCFINTMLKMYMYIDRTRFQKGQLSFSVHVHVYIYAKGYHGIYIGP